MCGFIYNKIYHLFLLSKNVSIYLILHPTTLYRLRRFRYFFLIYPVFNVIWICASPNPYSQFLEKICIRSFFGINTSVVLECKNFNQFLPVDWKRINSIYRQAILFRPWPREELDKIDFVKPIIINSYIQFFLERLSNKRVWRLIWTVNNNCTCRLPNWIFNIRNMMSKKYFLTWGNCYPFKRFYSEI